MLVLWGKEVKSREHTDVVVNSLNPRNAVGILYVYSRHQPASAHSLHCIIVVYNLDNLLFFNKNYVKARKAILEGIPFILAVPYICT